MAVQYVSAFRIRPVIHVNGIDVFSFLTLASIVPIYALDSLLPAHFKSIFILAGFLCLCIYHLSTRKKFGVPVILWGIFAMWLCWSNLMNSRDLLAAFFYPVKVATFILLNKFYLDRRDKTFLKIIRHYMTIILIINFVLQMFDQDMFGYTKALNYLNFFESDNYLGWYYVPYITLCLILDFVEKGRTRNITYFEIGLCMASIVRAWVGKTMIALALIILYIVFVYRKKISFAFTPKLLGIGYIVLDIGIVFFGMQNIFSASLYDFLGKEVTLGGRIYIWAAAIQNISKSPIWGYGITQGGELFINHVYGYGDLVPSHNLFLEVAIQSGLIGLILYLLILTVFLYIGAREGRRHLKNIDYRYEYLFLIYIIFIMFSMAILSQPVYIPFFYLPMILFSSFESLVDMHEKGKNVKTRLRIGARSFWI